MPPWNAAKAKVQLRISVQRLRILQQKKEAQAKAARRDIAFLLERSKIETARVKVENIINEDIHVELLELLELYCELLIARFGLLDQNIREPDPGVYEGVCAIIHAAPRTELKELHLLRDILMHKYGREFSVAVMDNKDGCVSDRVVRKLRMETPSSELVDAYLTEIAKAYSVEWPPAPPYEPSQSNDDDPSGGVGVSLSEKMSPFSDPIVDSKSAPDGRKTPKLPEIPPTEDEVDKSAKGDLPLGRKAAAKTASPRPEDDFDALARRFEALKRR